MPKTRAPGANRLPCPALMAMATACDQSRATNKPTQRAVFATQTDPARSLPSPVDMIMNFLMLACLYHNFS